MCIISLKVPKFLVDSSSADKHYCINSFFALLPLSQCCLKCMLTGKKVMKVGIVSIIDYLL